MADVGASESPTSAPTKKKRTFARRARERKVEGTRRACTPEPGKKVWTDESEKDASEGENVGRRRRTRSAERARSDEPDIEEDFEAIRNLHKSKELEEEKLSELEAKPKQKEEEQLKMRLVKEMPPLIVAPPEARKRVRRKDVIQKPLSTSEEEEEEVEEEDREKQATKTRKSAEGRKNRRIVKKENTESAEESEGGKSENVIGTEPGEEPVKPKQWFQWWVKKGESGDGKGEEKKKEAEAEEKKVWVLVRTAVEWREHVKQNASEWERMRRLRNRCVSHLLLMILYCGLGGFVFRFVEGAFETFYKCGVKRVKRDFIDNLWSYSQYMVEEEWKSQARRKLMEFENQLHAAHEAGMTTYSGQKSWSFLNAVLFCLTVITTIGYGHISPSTTTGRAITIIYAIFGIPMFLILLADFGKLFTRGIKFLWAFVRRLYYTGSCKKVRRTAPVQEMMKGVQFVYDFAKNRRPSQWGIDEHLNSQPAEQLRVPEGTGTLNAETPDTPNMSAFEIDDEFNLPISVAITILLLYIFIGATIYWMWEEWSFFESFYFVFISMSTIGFGDFVPQNPIYMMASIIYLIFGLALTSMCINVVQEKLSDTFRQASTKIGATIGLRIAEDGSLSAPPELADVNPLQNIK